MPKKKQYQFKRVETTGENSVLSPDGFLILGSESANIYGRNKLISCPYTEFIPLSYLLMGEYNGARHKFADVVRRALRIQEKNPNKLAKFGRKWQDRRVSTFMSSSITDDKKHWKTLTNDRLNRYLEFDEPRNLSYVLDYNLTNLHYKWMAMPDMQRMRTVALNQRSYRAVHTPYSLFQGIYEGGRQSYIPHMLAVVLPENYMYVKYHILKHNTIPLDKVIVLVNKELDSCYFKPPAFRKLYMEYMEEVVLKSACQVWKVPHSFIMDKCFIHDYKLKEENIFKRKGEIEELVGEFYETFNVKDEGLISHIDGAIRRSYTNERYTAGVYTRGDLSLEGIREAMGQMRATEGPIISVDYTNSDRWTWNMPSEGGTAGTTLGGTITESFDRALVDELLTFNGNIEIGTPGTLESPGIEPRIIEAEF